MNPEFHHDTGPAGSKAGKKKSMWCFTLEWDKSLESTGREGIAIPCGGLEMKLVVGPREAPDEDASYMHCHGYVQAPKQRSITKSVARRVIEKGYPGAKIMYLNFLWGKSWTRYREYCFKKETGLEDVVDRQIQVAADDIVNIQNQNLTLQGLNKRCAQLYNLAFPSKHKARIQQFFADSVLTGMGMEIDDEIDHVQAASEYYEAFVNFTEKISASVMAGSYQTEHLLFSTLGPEDIIRSIQMMVTLPLIVKRSKIPDNLPGLFLWGESNCGKSFMFNENPFIRMVSLDAEGVSRYKLSGMETSFLLEEISAESLTNKSNLAVIKGLCSGNEPRVKIHGDTLPVRGFVFANSNSTPVFYTDEFVVHSKKEIDVAREKVSYRRRFLCVQMTDKYTGEERVPRIDYRSRCVNSMAICLFVSAYKHVEDPKLKHLFERYYKHCLSRLDMDIISMATDISMDRFEEIEQMFLKEQSSKFTTPESGEYESSMESEDEDTPNTVESGDDTLKESSSEDMIDSSLLNSNKIYLL